MCWQTIGKDHFFKCFQKICILRNRMKLLTKLINKIFCSFIRNSTLSFLELLKTKLNDLGSLITIFWQCWSNESLLPTKSHESRTFTLSGSVNTLISSTIQYRNFTFTKRDLHGHFSTKIANQIQVIPNQTKIKIEQRQTFKKSINH